ncbi:zinc finger CCCH domain-containing protein 6-like protein [Tanacetum coccineum]
MSRKGESQPRVDGENCQLERLRTSSVRTVGVPVNPIPLIKWARPPRFLLDPDWEVETGSKSEEKHFQLKRESKVSEAKYHRRTYVPANPFFGSDALVFSDDDSKVPIIPWEEIDDETTPEDDDDGIPLVTLDPSVKVGETGTHPRTVSPLLPPQDNRGPEVSTQPLLRRDEVMSIASKVPIIPLEEIDGETALEDDDDGIPLVTLNPSVNVGETSTQPRTVSSLLPPLVNRGPEVSTQPLLRRDEEMAIALALVAWIKAKEPGSNIDTELLVQLLRNPGMLERLKNEHEDPAKPQVRSSPPLVVPKPTEVRSARTVTGTTLVVVQGPTLDVRPPRTVLGITPVAVQGPSLEVRPHRTVVGTTPVAVQGPTLPVRPRRTIVGTTPVAVQGPSLEVRPHRTVVGTTPVAVQGPSLEVRPRRTVVGTTPVAVRRPTLQVRPARSVVGIKPVAFQGPSLKLRPPKTVVGTTPVAVQGPTLDVSPARTVVRATPVAIPGPYIKSLAKVPVGSQTTWVPSVPFTHSMSQGVKNTIEGIHNHLDTHNPSSSKIDLGEVRKLINEYGVPLQADGYSCSPSAPKTAPLVIKDSDYYRSIISQHGIAQENPNPQGPVKTVRSNEQRVCKYFNSSNGCMRGSNCWFKHVKVSTEGGTLALEEQRVAKRMKFSGGNFAGHT